MGHDALVEVDRSTWACQGLVVLGARHVVVAVAGAVGREEAAAAHAGVAIAVALRLALRQLELAHLLLGDVVGTTRSAVHFGGQFGEVEVLGALADVVLLEHVDELGERGRDPHAGLVLDAQQALAQELLMIMARSRFSASLRASLRYMNTVTNGARPFVVMRVTTWYWMVWTPRRISSRKRPSTTSTTFSSGASTPSSTSSAST